MRNRVPLPTRIPVGLLAVLLVGRPAAAVAANYLIPPDADTWIQEDNPDQVKGDDKSLELKDDGGGKRRISLLRFDPSSIGAGETVMSAILRLWITNDNADPVRIFSVTEDWDELTTSWDSAGDAIDSTVVWGTFTPYPKDTSVGVDLRGLVESWRAGVPNHGLALVTEQGSGGNADSKYDSRETTTPAQAPYLDVKTSAVLGLADVAVRKSVDDATPAETDSVTFSVVVSNTGLAKATNVVVRERLPRGLTWVTNGQTQGSYDAKTGEWAVGSLATLASAQLNLVARADSGTAGETLTNWAWFDDASGQDGNSANDADSASVTVRPQTGVDVGVAIDADDVSPGVGQNIAFTVNLGNAGPEIATDIKTVVTVPAGLTVGLSSVTRGSWDSGSGLWTISSLAAGDSALLTFDATVDLGTVGDTLTVPVALTGVTPTDNTPENDQDAVLLVVQSADLAASVAVDDANPVEGDTVTLTTQLGNAGPAETTGVTVMAALPAGLSVSGYTVSRGSYDPLTGIWSVGSVPVAGVDSIVVTAVVDSGTAGSAFACDVAVSASDQQDPDPGNNNDQVTITVQSADLSITKVSLDGTNPTEGQSITYRLTVANHGPNAAAGVLVDDLLPTGVTWVGDSPEQGAYDAVAGRWTVGALAAGDSVSLDIDVTMDGGTAGFTIDNTATIAASVPADPFPADNGDSESVTVQSADLAVTKTASRPDPTEGDTVIYTVVVANHGPQTGSGIVVSDLLPAGVTFVAGAESDGSYDDATGQWTIASLAPSAVATLAIQTTVDAGTWGTTIINTATATSVTPSDPDSTNDSYSAAIVVQAADLRVTKSVSDPAPLAGQTISYTVVVANAGPDSATSVALSDVLPATLTFQNASSDHGTYDSGTGVWSVGTVAAADSATLSLAATVNGGTGGQTIWNMASLTGADQVEAMPGDEADSVSVTVLMAVPFLNADLEVDKTVDVPNPGENDTFHYTVTLTNNGPDATSAVTLTDKLPSTLSYVNSTPSHGSYAPGTGRWSVGSLGVGEIATLDLAARPKNGTAGRTITNTAGVTASAVPDPTPANSSHSVDITVTHAELALTKAVDHASPDEGDPVTYTILLRNDGPAPTTGVTVDDVLPAGLTFTGASSSVGSYASGTGVWSVGALAVDDTVSLSISAVVDAGTAGDTITNTATIATSDEGDTTVTDDSASAELTVRQCDVSLAKDVDDAGPGEGATVQYTLTLAAAGPDSAVGVVVTDSLPTGLTYQSDTPSQGLYDNGTGAWTAGGLAPGDTATLVIAATVDAGTNGSSIWNVASVTANDVADPVATNDVDSVRVDVPFINGITVGVSQASATRRPGQTNVGFATVAIANSAPGAYTLQSLSLTDVTAGPGTAPQLDAEFGTLTLYRDDGDAVFEPLADLPLAQATVSGGRVVFSGLDVAAPSGAAFTLHVGGGISLTARDGDVLDLEVAAPPDVVFDAVPVFRNAWPAAAAGGITVDGMVAAQVAVTALADANLDLGGPAVVAFEARLPANGYAADTLTELRLMDGGTATASSDYSLAVWADGGDGAFDGGASDDTLLGSPAALGSTWTLSGQSFPIPAGGLRVFAVAQAPGGGTAGATVDLAIPPTGDGIVVASGNDGPLDAGTAASRVLTIRQPPTMIDVLVRAQVPATLSPGDPPGEVLRFQLTNRGSFSETLDAVTLVNRTTGGGAATQANLDADWGALGISRDRATDGPGLERSIASTFSNGAVTFTGLGQVLAPGDSAELVVTGSAALTARDGDRLDLRIENGSALVFRRAVALNGAFPLDPAGSFPVDGLVAAQVQVGAVDPSLLAGEARRVSLDVLLPPNGYENDTLTRIDVQNLGTAGSGSDITRVEAWADDGDGEFDEVADTPLGELTFTGLRWERTALSLPVSAAGQRVFVTTDLSDLATAGRTVQLAIPGPPDHGLGMLSDNDGPLDAPVVPSPQTISTVDRIALTAVGVAPGGVAPGATDRVLLHLAAENTYSVSRTLTALTLRNVATGVGSIPELDAELEQLTLWIDSGNGSFDGAPVDQAVGTAFFTDGEAAFPGVSWTLASGATRHLWITGDVSPTAARDGDVLGAYVASPADVSFSEPVSLAAGFPLDSGARWTVDGLVAAQVANYGAPGLTLGPGEGPALALNVGLPANGYAADVLTELDVVNLGTAGAGDVADVRLWRDGGDGSFDAGGADDIDLGTMAFVAGRWVLPGLSEPLAGGGSRFFVSVSASMSPVDSSSIRLALPQDGLEMLSGNDGPRDATVPNANTLLLSTAVLLANLEITPAASTVDSTVTVTMLVRNLHATAAVDSVAPTALSPSGVGTLDLLTGPSPSGQSIPPQEERAFTWTYRAASSGEVRLTGSAGGVEAGSGVPHQSLAVTSNTHQVFVQAQDLDVYAVQSMPFSINRSQQNVVPLSLTFANPAGVGGSDIELRSFRVLLENEAGDPVVPADLLSRVVVNEGALVYLDKTSLETSPVEMDLTLAQPVLIESSGPSASATLAIALDISDSTSVPNFRLKVVDASWFEAQDATSGGPVNISLVDPTTFPITSGLARIVAEATQVDVTDVPATPFTVGQGQDDVPGLAFTLYNPDPSGLAADARVTTFDVMLVDDAGSAIASPIDWIGRVRVDGAAQNHLDRAITADDDSTITLSLPTLVSVPVNTPVPIAVRVDIATASALGTFRMELADSAFFEARDANTGTPLPVLYASDPVSGPQVTVQAPADSAVAAGAPLLPGTVAVGTGGVSALRMTLTHPGPAEAGPLRCDAVTLRCRDGAGAGLVPATYLDAVHAVAGGGEVGLATNMPATGSWIVVPLSGVVLAPFAQAVLDVRLDVRVTAPASLFSVAVSADGIDVVDANLDEPAAVTSAPGTSFPLTSGFTQLQTPARDLVVGFDGAMPAMLAADGGTVEVARLTLRNPAPATAGAIRVHRFDLLAAGNDLEGLHVGQVVSSVQAWVGDSLWADSGPLEMTDEKATLTAAADSLSIEPGETVEVRFDVALAGATEVSGFRVGFRTDGIGVVQPGSPVLSVSVLPEEGQTFPMWSDTGNFSGVTLKESYSNFPNPFAAGREETMLAFYLQDAGRVSLKLYTLRGELVRTLLEDVPMTAGPHQDTPWDGRNGRGKAVVNGVYLAEIVVAFDSGANERIVRKVAVVR